MKKKQKQHQNLESCSDELASIQVQIRLAFMFNGNLYNVIQLMQHIHAL